MDFKPCLQAGFGSDHILKTGSGSDNILKAGSGSDLISKPDPDPNP